MDGEVRARVLTNTVFAEPWYGHARVHDFRSMIKHRFREDEYERFSTDIMDKSSRGRYLYAIAGFAYVGRRAA